MQLEGGHGDFRSEWALGGRRAKWPLMATFFDRESRAVLVEFGFELAVAEHFLISTTVDEIGGQKKGGQAPGWAHSAFASAPGR